jgi:hypothetical protein
VTGGPIILEWEILFDKKAELYKFGNTKEDTKLKKKNTYP